MTRLSRRRALGLIGGTLAGMHPARSADDAIIEQPWSRDGLAGTLTLPKNFARSAAVLILAGSGPTDRDGNGPLISTDTYRLLAAGLAAQGIRSLRYDKRGVGASAKLVAREDDLRFGDLVNDAVAAARDLAGRADVSSVILAGHSEGGLVAMRAARELSVAGLVLLATPAAAGRRVAGAARGRRCRRICAPKHCASSRRSPLASAFTMCRPSWRRSFVRPCSPTWPRC